MNTSDRDALIAKYLQQGHNLSDVQKILLAEHDVNLTYMDLRLIAAELDVDWSSFDPVPENKDDDDTATEKADPSPAPGGTAITINTVVRPGTVLSGNVTFKSGATAEWSVDQMGRLGLNPSPDSPQATPEDLQDFQVELQKTLQSQGRM